MKAIVTGGAGFIGSHLVHELLRKGHHVLSIDDYSAGTDANLPHHRNLYRLGRDILDIDRLPFLGAEVVFHNAASKKVISSKDPRRDLDVNAAGTLHLLQLCAQSGVKRFIHASTGSVYGQPIDFPQTEDHPRNPISPYGISKMAGEAYVKIFHGRLGMTTTILRYFHVYGPRQNKEVGMGGVVGIFCDRAFNRLPLTLHGDGSQQRAFTYVADIVRANMLVLDRTEAGGEAYNCCSGVSVTVRDMGELLLRMVHPEDEDFHFNVTQPRSGEVYKFDVSNKKLDTLLGEEFTWTTLYDGLMRTLQWYRQT